MRSLVGVAAALHGVAYLTGDASTIWMRVIGALTILCGGSLLAGYRTHVMSAVIGLEAVCVASSLAPAPQSYLFAAMLPTIPVIVVSIAVVLLGPGSLSIDARLFGWREIVIARINRPPETEA